MLNKKKVSVACALALFLVSIGLGLIVLAKEDNKKLVALQEKASEANNSEENITLKNTERAQKAQPKNSQDSNPTNKSTISDKVPPVTDESKLNSSDENVKVAPKKGITRPTLKTASRGGNLAPKDVQKPQVQVKPQPQPAVEPAPANTINGWTEEDIYWLAKIIHAESRGEPYNGQVAVGAVIIRRVQHPDFPNTVKEVIFDRWEGKYYQFSPVADGSIWLEPNETAYQAARDAVQGIDPSGGALYFYNPVKSTSQWIFSRPITTKIGEHVFAL